MTKTVCDASESWSDSREIRVLKTSMDSGDEMAKRLDLLGADGVTVDISVWDEDAVTFGIYHRRGSLLEKTLTGPVSRTFELGVEHDNGDARLLFIKTCRTAADIEITLIRSPGSVALTAPGEEHFKQLPIDRRSGQLIA